MTALGKLLIVLGLILLIVGLAVAYLPGLRIGRLPGDVWINKGGWRLYIPITTSILLSLLLTLLLWIITSIRR